MFVSLRININTVQYRGFTFETFPVVIFELCFGFFSFVFCTFRQNYLSYSYGKSRDYFGFVLHDMYLRCYIDL